MISEQELIALIGQVETEALRRWVDLGWVLPKLDDDGPRFDLSDVARLRLICELHYELRIEEDSMPVVLSLMDQLYAARRDMRTLLAAVEAQPNEVRDDIAKHVKTSGKA